MYCDLRFHWFIILINGDKVLTTKKFCHKRSFRNESIGKYFKYGKSFYVLSSPEISSSLPRRFLFVVESNQSWILFLTFHFPPTVSEYLISFNGTLISMTFHLVKVQMKRHKSKLRGKGEGWRKKMCKNNRKTCRYECFISVRNFIVLSARDEMEKERKKFSKYSHATKRVKVELKMCVMSCVSEYTRH
jgi:hypothetical protein